MRTKRLAGLLAGATLAASALLCPLSTLAAEERVEKDVTMQRGASNGANGYWVTVKERVYRWVATDDYAGQMEMLPGGSELSKADRDDLAAFLKASGLAVDSAKLAAVVQAVRAWKSVQPGMYASMTQGDFNGRINDLAGRLSNALRATPAYNAQESAVATKLTNRLAAERGWSTYDPLVLDLNGNGKVDVTGLSAAKFRAPKNQVFVPQGSVRFDIRDSGQLERIEWVKAGDGLLVDNRKDKARKQLAAGKNLTISHLFGDTEGNPHGFVKLARFFDVEAQVASSGQPVASKGLGILAGKELDEMLVWVDDGDGQATASELHTLSKLGITEIRLPHRHLTNSDGELVEQAVFIRHGKPQIVQEVWFGRDDAAKP